MPVDLVKERERKWLKMIAKWDYYMDKKPRKVRAGCGRGPSQVCSATQAFCVFGALCTDQGALSQGNPLLSEAPGVAATQRGTQSEGTATRPI